MFEDFTKFCNENGFQNYIEQENVIKERKIKEMGNLMREILEMLNNKIREKRSLGPLKYVGSVAKYLFGVLDEDDKIYFDHNIEKLDKSDNDILAIIENQTQIIKSKFLICDDNFNYYNKKLNETLHTIDNKLSIARKIWFYMEMLNKFKTDFEIDALTLIDAIMFANKGQLHKKLISHNIVQKLAEAIKLAESNYDIPFSNSPSITEISQVSEITIYYNNDKIKYVIDIPLLDKENFILFKQYALPHPLGNSSLFAYI